MLMASKGSGLSCKHLIEAVVVANAGQGRSVGQRQCRERRPVLSVASTQFFCKVHGVAHGPAVATRQDFVSSFQRGDEDVRPTVHRLEKGSVLQQVLRKAGAFFEVVAEFHGVKDGVHASKLEKPAVSETADLCLTLWNQRLNSASPSFKKSMNTSASGS